MEKDEIHVSRPVLPEKASYVKYLDKIWDSKHLTNNGPLLLELEDSLKEYLGVKHVFVVANGTMALQLAIKALELSGEVVTTPFSYVATTSSLVWEGCTPVFADIENSSCNISVKEIERKINKNTSAILATHVYGNPVDVAGIERLALKHGLKVVYDAAHAFGVELNSKSVLSYGDVSTVSFHATKLFHSAEGGAVVTNNDMLAHKINYMRGFGHNGPEEYFGIGINGKNSEFHAAMGLCILPMVEDLIAQRKELYELYNRLINFSSTEVRIPLLTNNLRYNYSYYPIIFKDEGQLVRIKLALNEQNIFPRRYFYPSLNNLPYVQSKKCDVSDNISKRVLCLPLYNGLTEKKVMEITQIINEHI
jgi:dTDP-4-amino-4,6-dideoxygalactose transaminase